MQLNYFDNEHLCQECHSEETFYVSGQVNIQPGSRGSVIVSCLNCFGGGVILTTALTHMLPEVNLFLAHNIASGQIEESGLPLAEIWVLCGFFMIYFVEEVTASISYRWPDSIRFISFIFPLVHIIIICYYYILVKKLSFASDQS